MSKGPSGAAGAPRPRYGGARRGSLGSAISLYFSLLGVSAITVILVLWGDVSEVSAEIFGTVGLTLVVLFWMVADSRRVLPALARVGPARLYPISVGLGCLTFATAWVAVSFFVAALDLEQLTYSGPFLKAGYGWGTVILVICVQPAIIEELAFRGVILGALQDTLGRRDAIIVSALMFMVLHLAVFSFPHLLLMGLVLGHLRMRTGSLYPCMVLHFTHNLLVVLEEMGGG